MTSSSLSPPPFQFRDVDTLRGLPTATRRLNHTSFPFHLPWAHPMDRSRGQRVRPSPGQASASAAHWQHPEPPIISTRDRQVPAPTDCLKWQAHGHTGESVSGGVPRIQGELSPTRHQVRATALATASVSTPSAPPRGGVFASLISGRGGPVHRFVRSVFAIPAATLFDPVISLRDVARA